MVLRETSARGVSSRISGRFSGLRQFSVARQRLALFEALSAEFEGSAVFVENALKRPRNAVGHVGVNLERHPNIGPGDRGEVLQHLLSNATGVSADPQRIDLGAAEKPVRHFRHLGWFGGQRFVATVWWSRRNRWRLSVQLT
jgi:hypothetical protein